jgi:hypothetical protein
MSRRNARVLARRIYCRIPYYTESKMVNDIAEELFKAYHTGWKNGRNSKRIKS